MFVKVLLMLTDKIKRRLLFKKYEKAFFIDKVRVQYSIKNKSTVSNYNMQYKTYPDELEWETLHSLVPEH